MPAALVTAMAGAYTLQYAPPSGAAGYATPESESGYGALLTLGKVRNGMIVGRQIASQPVTADYYGSATELDHILQGVNCTLTLELMEWGANERALIYPWGLAGSSADLGVMPQAGTRLSNKAGIIVLTAATGSPAATSLGPNTLTAKMAILSPQTNVELLLQSALRTIPVQFKLLPYSDGSYLRHFSVT